MSIVVAFVSAVLLALQLSPTSALVIRPRRELPDFFSQILQRVKKDAVVDDSTDTGEEDGHKKCTRNEDCEEGKLCTRIGQSTPLCRNHFEVVEDLKPTDDYRPWCPPFTLYYRGKCLHFRERSPWFPAMPEGFACNFTYDCREGLCCGHSDGGSKVCKTFLKKGEPCKHDGSVYTVWPTGVKRQGGGCCKDGLRCGDDGVCIVDEDLVHFDEETEEIPKPPAEDEKTDDNPEKNDDNPEKNDHSPEKNDDNPEKTGDNRDKIDDSPE